MNLENFDHKSSLIINTAFNYASENNFAYLSPLNILEIILQTKSSIKQTLEEFSVNADSLLKEKNIMKKQLCKAIL